MRLDILIRFIIGMVFVQGMLGYLGVPSFYYRAVIEISILLLFINAVYSKTNSLKIPGILWFLIFSVVVLSSTYLNNSDWYITLLMYRQILWPYLFFVCVLNLNISTISLHKINKFIVAFVLIQIPAAIYKYGMYGVREGELIGTFDLHAGSMSTVFPLFIIVYLVAFYFIYKNNNLFLWLVPAFMFFAWGGGKRAFFIILPLLLIIAFIVYYKTIHIYRIKNLKLSLILAIIAIMIGATIYIGGKYHPRFNPEQDYGGSFDLSFIISTILEYETRVGQDHVKLGRYNTFQSAIFQIWEGDLQKKLFGDGPDRLYTTSDRGDSRDEYGIGYGITGFVFHIISIGILGTLSFLLLFLYMGIIAYKSISIIKDPFYKAIGFGTVLATSIFFIDYLSYSTAFITAYMPSVLYFYIIGILIKQKYYFLKINKTTKIK